MAHNISSNWKKNFYSVLFIVASFSVVVTFSLRLKNDQIGSFPLILNFSFLLS